MSARNGAYSTGSAIITATSDAGTPSSTIITRLSVPTSSTNAMPTDTWNSARRSRRDSGRSGVAASANGRKRGPSAAHVCTRRMLRRVMWGQIRVGRTASRGAGMQHPGPRIAIHGRAGLQPDVGGASTGAAELFAGAAFAAPPS